MIINETFQSIQGEGRSAGQLANFVRVYGCPLSCVWCDTAYSWDSKNYDPKQEMTQMSIEDVCLSLNVKDYLLTVLTGGEPLLYQDDLVALIEAVWDDVPTHKFEIETAGSLPVKRAFFQKLIESSVHLNFSPKLSNSGNGSKSVDTSFMNDLCILGEITNAVWPTVKFVVSRPKDFIEIGEFCAFYNIPRHAVFIMAEGETMQKQIERMPWAISMAMANHYNFTPRLHVLAWNNARGV